MLIVIHGSRRHNLRRVARFAGRAPLEIVADFADFQLRSIDDG